MKLFFRLIIFLGCLAWSQAQAQMPTVPSRMDFAGMKLRIHDSGRDDIQESVDALTRSQTHYNIMAEKARSYFPIIERIFREEHVPTDFKYLVLQESGLQADAVSSSDAVGYWQFKDFTGMEMGLRIDRHIDERMNIVAATRAAAQYIKKNNSFFDNWLQALQAYQMGPGGAMRVLDNASGAKSMTVDKKTYWYVKKYLAHKVAYENMVNEEPQIKLTEYTNGAGKTLKDIAKEVNVSEEELMAYNKWLLKGRIPDDKIYTVIIPSDQYIEQKDNTRLITKNHEQQVKQPANKQAINYKFVDRDLFPKIELEDKGFAQVNGLPGLVASSGDKVAGLAEKGGVSLSRFLQYNDINIDHHVHEGEIFYLRKKRAKAKTYYHILQPGEDLWEVSQKYGLRLKKLKMKNRIRTDEPALKPGRVLWLRYVRPARIPVAYEEVTVPKPRPSETATDKIEKPVEVQKPEVQDSVQLRIFPLKIPKGTLDTTRQTQPVAVIPDEIATEQKTDHIDSVRRIHTVEPGETYYAISKIYNTSVLDLLRWNNMKINDKLAIGQKLVVYEHTLTDGSDEDKREAKKIEEAPFIYYTVQPGDTLYKIARSYEITVEELMDLNDKSDFSLNLGEKIKVGRKMLSD